MTGTTLLQIRELDLLYPASIDDATERHDAEAILSVLNLEAAAQRLSAVKQKQCRCCYVGKG